MRRFFYAFIFILTIISCQENKEIQKPTKNNSSIEKQKKDIWQFDEDLSSIHWTGYKTTAKVPVSGTFQKFNVRGIKSSPDLWQTIKSARVSIMANSIFSNEEQRDKKLVQFLFETMLETQTIDARIEQINKEKKSGMLHINMNGVEKLIPIQVQVNQEQGKVILNGKIDLLEDFQASNSLEALHKACYDLHTGEDGISKTWSDVAFKAELIFKK